MTDKTIALLEQIKARILSEPLQFNMTNWFNDELDVEVAIPNCGTACCIAGWAIAISRGQTPRDASDGIFQLDCQTTAQMYLDVTHTEGQSLFYVSNWPLEFKLGHNNHRYADATLTAINAVERIDHFIKTEGKE